MAKNFRVGDICWFKYKPHWPVVLASVKEVKSGRTRRRQWKFFYFGDSSYDENDEEYLFHFWEPSTWLCWKQGLKKREKLDFHIAIKDATALYIQYKFGNDASKAYDALYTWKCLNCKSSVALNVKCCPKCRLGVNRFYEETQSDLLLNKIWRERDKVNAYLHSCTKEKYDAAKHCLEYVDRHVIGDTQNTCFTCDSCEKRRIGECWSCDICDFDLCGICYSRPGIASSHGPGHTFSRVDNIASAAEHTSSPGAAAVEEEEETIGVVEMDEETEADAISNSVSVAAHHSDAVSDHIMDGVIQESGGSYDTFRSFLEQLVGIRVQRDFECADGLSLPYKGNVTGIVVCANVHGKNQLFYSVRFDDGEEYDYSHKEVRAHRQQYTELPDVDASHICRKSPSFYDADADLNIHCMLGKDHKGLCRNSRNDVYLPEFARWAQNKVYISKKNIHGYILDYDARYTVCTLNIHDENCISCESSELKFSFVGDVETPNKRRLSSVSQNGSSSKRKLSKRHHTSGRNSPALFQSTVLDAPGDVYTDTNRGGPYTLKSKNVVFLLGSAKSLDPQRAETMQMLDNVLQRWDCDGTGGSAIGLSKYASKEDTGKLAKYLENCRLDKCYKAMYVICYAVAVSQNFDGVLRTVFEKNFNAFRDILIQTVKIAALPPGDELKALKGVAQNAFSALSRAAGDDVMDIRSYLSKDESKCMTMLIEKGE